VPRYNEFRRQIGLRQLADFDDFIDQHPSIKPGDLAEQRKLVNALREIYGQHRCDASKVITRAQLDQNGGQINDCLSHPDGSMVDNIEDVDLVVGFLAETTRPHGLRHFGNSVSNFHSQRIAAAVQRPVLHLELPAGVLLSVGDRLGNE
jgi:hypothetical protein